MKESPNDASNADRAEATDDAVSERRYGMTEERVLFVVISVMIAGVVLFLAIKAWAL